MDRSSRPPTPKDDDSWGKLASDLFGIDLGPQDDFDFAEAEKPSAPAPVPVAAVTPDAVPAELKEVPFEEEFVDAEDDEAADAVPEVVVEPEHDEYWDALETWDWNEGERAREKRIEGGQSSERTTRDDDRVPRGGGGRPPRGRGGRNDAPRSDRSRPPRGESRRSDAPQPESARTESVEPKVAAPRREGSPSRAGERRPPADRPPRRPAAESAAGPPARPRPPLKKKPVSDDEFGSGLDEEFEDQDAGWEAEPEEPRREVRVPQERLDDEDFAVGLDEDRGEGGSDDREEEGDDQGRPKRRRRRRRRGRGSAERSETAAVGDESSGDRSAEDFDDEESAEDHGSDDELSAEDRPADGDDSADSEERPRRRRRRRRRRPGSAPAEGAPARARADDSDHEEDDDDDERDEHDAPAVIEQAAHLDEVFDDEDPEPIQRVSYDDVPTWDEAISYLVKMPAGGDSRGRGGRDQGNRGRRPPPRRPRSDAPPNA